MDWREFESPAGGGQKTALEAEISQRDCTLYWLFYVFIQENFIRNSYCFAIWDMWCHICVEPARLM